MLLTGVCAAWGTLTVTVFQAPGVRFAARTDVMTPQPSVTSPTSDAIGVVLGIQTCMVTTAPGGGGVANAYVRMRNVPAPASGAASAYSPFSFSAVDAVKAGPDQPWVLPSKSNRT